MFDAQRLRLVDGQCVRRHQSQLKHDGFTSNVKIFLAHEAIHEVNVRKKLPPFLHCRFLHKSGRDIGVRRRHSLRAFDFGRGPVQKSSLGAIGKALVLFCRNKLCAYQHIVKILRGPLLSSMRNPASRQKDNNGSGPPPYCLSA